jgi:hypothetical protein
MRDDHAYWLSSLISTSANVASTHPNCVMQLTTPTAVFGDLENRRTAVP